MYQQALDMFPVSKKENDWTAEELEVWISNYGCPGPTLGEPMRRITSLMDRKDSQEIIQRCIDVDREHLFGLNPDLYLGMVHYNDVPLDGERSDLTARFHILKVGAHELTLEFLDIHVM